MPVSKKSGLESPFRPEIFRPFLNQGKQTQELASLPADVTIRSASATSDISNTPTAFKLDV